MGSLLRRSPLVAYFAIAQLSSWAMLLPLGLAERDLLGLPIRPWRRAAGALRPDPGPRGR